MPSTLATQIRAAIFYAGFATCLCADDHALTDADLPQPFDDNAAHELLSNSPFTRTLNLADSLRLTGIAYVGGRPVATFIDTVTREGFVVSEEPNAMGWKLVETRPSTELRRTQVKVMIGSEIVSVRYSSEPLTPVSAKKSAPAPRPVAPGFSAEQQPNPSSSMGENGNDIYASLSDRAREKFKDSMAKGMSKHPELTDEERAVYAQKILAKLQASDLKAASGDPDVKVPKSSKRGKGM